MGSALAPSVFRAPPRKLACGALKREVYRRGSWHMRIERTRGAGFMGGSPGRLPMVTAVVFGLVLQACTRFDPTTDTAPETMPVTLATQVDVDSTTCTVGVDSFRAVENLGGVNTSLFEGSPTVSADERTLFFTSNRMDGRENLFMSTRQRKNDSWGEAVSLGSPVNDPVADDNALRLSRDGKSLYFSSQRPGGFGSSDLYVTRRKSPSHPGSRPRTWDR